MKRSIVLLSVVIFLSLTGCHSYRTITISKSTLQEQINKKFPIDKNMIIARFTLDTPDVYFTNQNIGIKLKYKGIFLTEEINGYLDVNGRIAYNQGKGAFYLADINIEKLEVNGLSFSDNNKVIDVIQNIADNCLDEFPVYQFDQKKFRQKIAKIFLKELTIKDEELVIKLGRR